MTITIFVNLWIQRAPALDKSVDLKSSFVTTFRSIIDKARPVALQTTYKNTPSEMPNKKLSFKQ